MDAQILKKELEATPSEGPRWTLTEAVVREGGREVHLDTPLPPGMSRMIVPMPKPPYGNGTPRVFEFNNADAPRIVEYEALCQIGWPLGSTFIDSPIPKEPSMWRVVTNLCTRIANALLFR